MRTVRDGRVPAIFDDMKVRCPEFKDFLADYDRAWQSETTLRKLEGQLLSLRSVKDHPELFRYCNEVTMSTSIFMYGVIRNSGWLFSVNTAGK